MNNTRQYEYGDGSGNRYVLTSSTLSYVPVRVEESSSGTYSGGDPKEILLKGNQFNSIRELLDKAISKSLSSSIHIEGRAKMSGVISVLDKNERKEYILKPGSEEMKAIEALLKELLE
jgi:hypothetical protein